MVDSATTANAPVKNPSRYMTATYIFSLSVLAVLSIGVHLMLDRAIAEQTHTGSLVNVSGQQRMLSQRVSLFVTRYYNERDTTTKAVALDALDQMRKNHVQLTGKHQEAVSAGTPSPLSAALQNLYFSPPQDIENKLREFDSLAREALDAIDEGAAPPVITSLMRPLLAMSESTLLSALELAVKQYETEGTDRIDQLRRAQSLVLAIVFITLLIEGFYIFRPMVNRISDFAIRLQKAASHDFLTELLNRRAFFLTAEPIVSLAKRSKTPYSIVFLDIDHFKKVNDTFGHEVGDKALKHFAHILRDCYRDSDVVARFGGEEFTALLPGTDASAAVTFTQRVRTAMNENPVNVGDELLTLKFSSGIASSEIGNDNLQYLISIAGKALSDAKTSGRDRTRVYSEADIAA